MGPRETKMHQLEHAKERRRITEDGIRQNGEWMTDAVAQNDDARARSLGEAAKGLANDLKALNERIDKLEDEIAAMGPNP
jgi:hypothetical protein